MTHDKLKLIIIYRYADLVVNNFAMASVNWLGTLNNPEVESVEDYLRMWYEKAHAKYVVGQLERGAEGTVHVQYFVNFKKPGQRLSYLKKYCARSHFEVVKFNNGADKYCMKEDTRVEGPWEFGEKPVRRNDGHDWEEIKQSAINGEIDKVPGDIYIKHY